MSYSFKIQNANPQFVNVIDVTPQEVHDAASQLTLIDVRQPEEYVGELGHIENSKLIVLNEIPQKFSQIPTDKPIVFVCRSGGRSAQAAAFVHAQGIKNVYNMMGGMMAWNTFQFKTKNTTE